MAGALLFASDAENVIVRILPPPEFVKELFGQLVGKGNGPAELFFLAIVAPVTEELLFRGVMLTGFLPRYGRGRTMIGTAFLFGLIHLNPWQFVPAFILGVLFAWWRIESNSLWPPLVAHAITNGSAYFLNLGQDPADVFNPEAQPVWLSALGIALLSGGLWWSVQVYRGSARRNAAVEVPL
jgi:membrane protease YdiL (CAAX protease family)